MKEITEEHCAIIHPYLPVQRGNVRIPNIIFINALLFIAENGCKWRALPESWDELVENAPMVMDRAYEGDKTRQLVRDLRMTPVVPPKANRKDPWDLDEETCRVRPIFFGQAATRQILQSRKSARCLFSIQHSMASRGLAPDFAQRRPALSAKKNGMHPDLQAAERGRTAVRQTQALEARLHAVRQARRDVFGLRQPRPHLRHDLV